jgi:predicted nucleotidyltransferase
MSIQVEQRGKLKGVKQSVISYRADKCCSAARGDEQQTSDIDLLVELEKAVP